MSTIAPPKTAFDALPERGSEPTPLVPDAASWQAMTPAQREAAMWEIIDGMPLSETMSEGMRHTNAKMAVVDRLRRFYKSSNRGILIAPELAVLYPGERSFVPDVLAVRDVDLHNRDAWIVMDEGRGPDFILEIRNKGRRAKDYVRNVAWFARLGIREYFVHDCRREELAGYRLPSPDAQRYEPIIPQAGRYRSEVLELDLSAADGGLRFFFANSEISDVDAELVWLSRLVADREARLEEETRRAAAETERAAAETERSATLTELLKSTIRSLLAARGVALDAAAAARLDAVSDPDALGHLVARAATATEADALFIETSPA